MANNPLNPRSSDTAPAVTAAPRPAAPLTPPPLPILTRIELLVLVLATASLPILTDLAILTPQLAADIGTALLAVATGLHLPDAVRAAASGRATRGGG